MGVVGTLFLVWRGRVKEEDEMEGGGLTYESEREGDVWGGDKEEDAEQG